MDCAGIKVSRNWCLWFFIRARCTGPSPRHNEGNPNSAMAETKPGYCCNASSSKGIIPRAQLSMALQGRYLRQKGDSQERLGATVMFEKIFSSYVFLYSSFISAYCCSSTVCILQRVRVWHITSQHAYAYHDGTRFLYYKCVHSMHICLATSSCYAQQNGENSCHNTLVGLCTTTTTYIHMHTQHVIYSPKQYYSRVCILL